MRLGECRGNLAEDVSLPPRLWMEDGKHPAAIVLRLPVGLRQLPRVTELLPTAAVGMVFFVLVRTVPSRWILSLFPVSLSL